LGADTRPKGADDEAVPSDERSQIHFTIDVFAYSDGAVNRPYFSINLGVGALAVSAVPEPSHEGLLPLGSVAIVLARSGTKVLNLKRRRVRVALPVGVEATPAQVQPAL
jgi:hypothetical protein